MPAPLVSAVMITGKSADRQKLAVTAIESFLQQTYENKELIIVNDSLGSEHEYKVVSSAIDNKLLKEYRLPKQTSLGALRNFALKKAQGEWLIQFDDDDWSHPERIAWQMQRVEDAKACVLLSQVRCNLARNSALAYVWPKDGIAGTILHKAGNYKYPDKALAEDSDFLLGNFPGYKKLDNKSFPHLYLRFFHGAKINSWGERHVMKQLTKRANVWLPAKSDNGLSQEAADYLRNTISCHYQKK